jgi:hypothetical protein
MMVDKVFFGLRSYKYKKSPGDRLILRGTLISSAVHVI